MYYITDVEGVRCYGIKEGRNGLGLVSCSGYVAGVFTKNRFKSASVKVTRRNVRKGRIDGIVVNSGSANAFTGDEGIRNAIEMTEMLAERLGTDRERIAIASTGIIGVQVDMEWIRGKFDVVFKNMGSDEEHAIAFARSIITTDRFLKFSSLNVNNCLIAGVCKGAGMIAPNMSTMLAFIFTDASFKPKDLREMLRRAVDLSFNTITVDGDCSTNDTVLLISTDKKEVDKDKFFNGLKHVCLDLAKKIVKDGEGSTKVLKVEVINARNKRDAFKASKTIASSLLVKTALFGNDPNWGRIIASLGYSGVDSNERLDINLRGYRCDEFVAEVKLVENGRGLGNEDVARKIIESCDEIHYVIDLKVGTGRGYAFGCDLSYDYVKINSEYTT